MVFSGIVIYPFNHHGGGIFEKSNRKKTPTREPRAQGTGRHVPAGHVHGRHRSWRPKRPEPLPEGSEDLMEAKKIAEDIGVVVGSLAFFGCLAMLALGGAAINLGYEAYKRRQQERSQRNKRNWYPLGHGGR